MKSVKIPWYQKPLLHNNEYLDIQKGAIITGFFAIVSIGNKADIPIIALGV